MIIPPSMSFVLLRCGVGLIVFSNPPQIIGGMDWNAEVKNHSKHVCLWCSKTEKDPWLRRSERNIKIK